MNKNSYTQNVMIFVRKQGISSISDYVRIIPAIDCHSFYFSRSFPLSFSLALFPLCFLPHSVVHALSKKIKHFVKSFWPKTAFFGQFACQKKFRLDIHRGVSMQFPRLRLLPNELPRIAPILMFFLNSIKLV